MMDSKELEKIELALKMPFPVNKIHWRVGATNKKKNPDNPSGVALAYLDARDVQDRLNQACGVFGWQTRYPLSESGLLICEIGLKHDGEWIWKANGAGDTQVEAEKGKASDAFKRAGVMWGIGRYLYSLPNKWYPLNKYGNGFEDPHGFDFPDWATPEGYMKIINKRKENEAV
jgi:hypothetical protein